MEVENQIWNTSNVGNFFQICMDVELIKRFQKNWFEWIVVK
jgi:hypothetical protein